MSIEQNKALARQMVEVIFNQGNVSRVEEFLSPDFVEREELPPGMPQGREGVKQLTGMIRNAFPDFKATIEDMIAEGDKVACRWSATATHKGEFMGMPPTNKQVTITGLHIDRIAGGKIAETWNYSDMMGVMQQLGMKPPG